jgi:hypothetical protein
MESARNSKIIRPTEGRKPFHLLTSVHVKPVPDPADQFSSMFEGDDLVHSPGADHDRECLIFETGSRPRRAADLSIRHTAGPP